MAILDSLTKEALERELNSIAQMGRFEYLRQHGILDRVARTNFIPWGDESYDMKAVVAVALGDPRAKIGPSSAVRKRVEELGIAVAHTKP